VAPCDSVSFLAGCRHVGSLFWAPDVPRETAHRTAGSAPNEWILEHAAGESQIFRGPLAIRLVSGTQRRALPWSSWDPPPALRLEEGSLCSSPTSPPALCPPKRHLAPPSPAHPPLARSFVRICPPLPAFPAGLQSCTLAASRGLAHPSPPLPLPFCRSDLRTPAPSPQPAGLLRETAISVSLAATP